MEITIYKMTESVKFIPGQHIHLVGIGGSGMSAIARILVERGYKVTGSDRNTNDLTDALARDGATIYQGHDAAYVQGADMVLITSAVKDDHVEVKAAREAGIPVYKRQDIMAALMEDHFVVAVAGTKGKTTTTSMIVHILRECGADPSYIVGGVTGNTNTNAGVGKGTRKIFVVEADEYDNMFHGLRPDIAVITNLEWDHPDFFDSPESMFSSFQHFVRLLDEKNEGGGTLIVCADDERAYQLGEEHTAKPWTKTYTYGLSAGADIQALDVKTDSDGYTTFEIRFNNIDAGRAKINLAGSHNVRNALAALLVAPPLVPAPMFHAGIPALATFKPTARRFDLRADVNGIAIVDDYAHNPMSIRAVLEAACQRYPDRELWAVWQPHTYSRTQALFDDFAKSFDQADHVLITDIYAARENPIPGVTSAGVVDAINNRARIEFPSLPSGEGIFARHTPTFADTVKVLHQEVKSPAVILIMSAGDAPQIGVDYLKLLIGEAAS
jgi:UDP-N-acetylmuramate--alanine ligase